MYILFVERNVFIMKKLSFILVSVLCAATLCSCGGNNRNNVTPSPEPTLAVTNEPTSTADTAHEGRDGSVVDDMGNMVEDAGNAVGDAAKGVGDAVNDVVGNGNNNR